MLKEIGVDWIICSFDEYDVRAFKKAGFNIIIICSDQLQIESSLDIYRDVSTLMYKWMVVSSEFSSTEISNDLSYMIYDKEYE